jgi:hypothetical protein
MIPVGTFLFEAVSAKIIVMAGQAMISEVSEIFLMAVIAGDPLMRIYHHHRPG